MAFDFKNDVSAFMSGLKEDAEKYRGHRPFETLMRGLSDGTIEFKWNFGGRFRDHPAPLEKPDWMGMRYALSSPFIYAMIVPTVILDITVSLYQAICFPLWNVRKIKRSDYVIVDRHRLSFLSGFQKLNCLYCGYANGVFGFARMVAGETERFWCPIKHEQDIPSPHAFYIEFAEYNDAEGWKNRQNNSSADL